MLGLPWPGCGGRPCGRSVVTSAGRGPMQRFALQAVIKRRTSRPQELPAQAAWVGVSETVHFAPIEADQAGLRLAQKFGSQHVSHRLVLGWWQSTLRCHHGASDVQAAWSAYDEACKATEIQFNCQIPGCRRMCCSLGPLSVLMRRATSPRARIMPATLSALLCTAQTHVHA